MAIRSRFATVVVGTISILSLQLFGVLNPAQTKAPRPSIDSALQTSIVADLPANAASNSTNIPPVEKKFIISQATGSRVRFVPPVAKNPRRSQGAGSRGCAASLPVDLVTLLIPSKDYIGQTTSGHPTFFWNLSQSISVPIKFTLVESGVAEPLFEKQIDSPQAGIMQLKFPKDRPELTAGRIYGWSVTLICNARRPSANPYYYSWIERVPTTPALEQQLAAITSNSNSPAQRQSSGNASSDRASIYAQAGLWYDALGILSNAQTANPNEPSVQKDLFSLLDQVGLTHVVQQQQQVSQKTSGF